MRTIGAGSTEDQKVQGRKRELWQHKVKNKDVTATAKSAEHWKPLNEKGTHLVSFASARLLPGLQAVSLKLTWVNILPIHRKLHRFVRKLCFLIF